MISKKHLILNKVRLDLEKRGETVSFNLPTTTTTCCPSHQPQQQQQHHHHHGNTLPTPSNKRQRISIDTTSSSIPVGAVAVDDIMTPKDHIHPEEFIYAPVASSSIVELQQQQQQEQPKRRTRSNSGASKKVTSSPQRGRSQQKSNNSGSSGVVSSSSSAQVECCVKGCENSVTNRLRFSLRCMTEDDFKPDFISSSHNKVCHYHYFADLYKFKKANKAKNGSTTNNGNKKTVTAPVNAKKPAVVTVSNSKRSRQEFEQAPSFVTTTQAPIRLPSISSFTMPLMIDTHSTAAPLLHQCKAVTPVSRQDASVFFNFVGVTQNTFQRAM